MEFALPKSISIVVPAFNEVDNLPSTIRRIIAAIVPLGTEFEVIIVNDCSTDETGSVADRLGHEFANVRVIHNAVNLGFGGAYKRVVEEAQLAYTIMIPGDDAYPLDSLRAIFAKVGTADVVVSYTVNMQVRSPLRRFISHTFSFVMNTLFGLRLKYFNGVSVLPTEYARELRSSDSFGYAAENLVRLIKIHGFSYTQVPVEITERKAGRSKAFTLRNIWLLSLGILDLLTDVYWRHPRQIKARLISQDVGSSNQQ